MLIKNYLANQICTIDIPHPEYIVLKLKFMPSTTIIGSYIPPSDSQYHSFAPLSETLQLIEKASPNDRFVVIGDLNARFAREKPAFVSSKEMTGEWRYAANPDQIEAPNTNAKYVMSTLGKHLVLLNGLQHNTVELQAALTFRQKQKWISELDVCLATPQCIPAVESFAIHQRTDLPSDHAPISVMINVDKINPFNVDHSQIEERASGLGRHPSGQYDQGNMSRERQIQQRKPIRMENIDKDKLKATLRTTPPPPLHTLDVHAIADAANEALYEAARRSLEQPEINQQQDTNSTKRQSSRWNELTEKEPRVMWKAINWNGVIRDDREKRPEDGKFREHFVESPRHPSQPNGLRINKQRALTCHRRPGNSSRGDTSC